VLIDNYKIRVFGYEEDREISSPTFRSTDQAGYEQGSLRPNSRYRVEALAVVAGVQGPTANYSVQTSEEGEINYLGTVS
jgi:hypothetical protein